MTNVDTILEVRGAGKKPSAVFVDLVKTIDTGAPRMSMSGHVTCEITPNEVLSDLDFRIFRGLYVLTFDYTGDRDRHRRLAKLIAEADPSLLVMFEEDEGATTIYRRESGNPATTETYRV